MAIKVVERRPLTLAERTYLPQILAGLKVTWDNMVRPSVTLQYPEERPAIPQNYRGVPTLVMDPNGREKCVSCQLCEFVCPPKAIRITPGEIAPDAAERLDRPRPVDDVPTGSRHSRLDDLVVSARGTGKAQHRGRGRTLLGWT